MRVLCVVVFVALFSKRASRPICVNFVYDGNDLWDLLSDEWFSFSYRFSDSRV